MMLDVIDVDVGRPSARNNRALLYAKNFQSRCKGQPSLLAKIECLCLLILIGQFTSNRFPEWERRNKHAKTDLRPAVGQ